MDKLQIFNYQQSQVRTVMVNGEPWFIAKDVCEILDHSDVSTAVRRLDDDEKLTQTLFVSGQNREVWLVNEPGLYSLTMTSRKPEAKEFKRWVIHEVLPSIRRHGLYANPDTVERILANPDFGIRLLEEVKRERAEKAALAAENAALRPKAEQHDQFLAARNAQSIAVVAKSLGTGRDRLFRFLKEQKILLDNNTPYQRYLDRGYFRVVEKTITLGDRQKNIPQTLVTAKGVEFIARLLKEKKGA